MNAMLACLVGVGLGLAFYSGLWLDTRRALHSGRMTPLTRLARLGLAGVTFYALSCEGVIALMAGLGGFWLARGYLILRLGGAGDGRQGAVP